MKNILSLFGKESALRLCAIALLGAMLCSCGAKPAETGAPVDTQGAVETDGGSEGDGTVSGRSGASSR